MTLPDLKTIDCNGRTMSYREAGQGPAALFLHGIGSGSGSYQGQFDGLGDSYRMIAWDAPGYGKSDPFAAETPTSTDYADAAARLSWLAVDAGDALEELDINPLFLRSAGEGAVAVDARARLEGQASRPK